MNFNLSQHALEEIVLRSIPVEIVHQVVHAPEQVVPGQNGKKVYQSRVDFGGKMFLVRAVVDDKVDPGTIVTVYRTSRIEKYWVGP